MPASNALQSALVDGGIHGSIKKMGEVVVGLPYLVFSPAFIRMSMSSWSTSAPWRHSTIHGDPTSRLPSFDEPVSDPVA